MQFLYPEGKKKALTFSYDDGQIHDRRLVELFSRYGLKGTFHLNSGRLDTPDYVSSVEVRALYEGQEIACHGVTHAFPTQLSNTQLVNELWNDRRALEQKSGQIVTGLSYAFGDYDARVTDCCRMADIEYARTVEDTGRFLPPQDFLRWHPTCHHSRAMKDPALIEAFLHPQPWIEVPLLYLWGHSYEFELEHNWDEMEALCAKLAGHEDVWYTTNRDYCRYLKAVRGLVYSADETMVYNPSATRVWLKREGGIVVV